MRLLEAFVNCKKRLLTSSCLSVRSHGTTRLPLDTLSWKLIFEYFSKICLEKFKCHCRKGQIRALDRVQKKAAKFAYHMNESKWKKYRSVERYHVYVLSSNRTLENGRGRLWVTDCNGPTIWAGLIKNGKSGTGGKGRMSGNIPLWIGPSDSGTGYLPKF